jgi:small-conductance mechanosensitive channel
MISDLIEAAEDFPVLLANVGQALVLVLLVYLAYRLAWRAVRALKSRGRLTEQIAFVIQRILRWSAVVLGCVVVLQAFGFLQDVWALVSTVVALVAIGFVAVWSVMSNVLCSLILILARPFQVGDTIVLPSQDLEGKVVNFTLLFTVLKHDDGDLIQIPNNTFFQTAIRRRPGASAVSLKEQLEKTENAE